MKILMVAYDNESMLTWFPQGLAYLASACLKAGHEVEVYQQDIYHWHESHLSDKLDGGDYDVVLVSIIGGYYQYKKLIKLSAAINSSKNRQNFTYLIGGHGPASDPEYFLKLTSADFVGIGEGEISVVNLLTTIENKGDFSKVHGIAYMDQGHYIRTKSQALIENIDEIDYPAWDLFNIDYYALLRMPNIAKTDRSFPVLSGRGCPFKCNFCYRLDKGFRARSAESIISEIRLLVEKYHINYIIFSDELLMSSVERTIEISQAIKDSKLDIKWECNGRLNYATEEVLTIMKDAGCVFINYGIESLDDATLKVMRKALTKEMIIAGVEATLKVGISPGLNIIYGNIDEPLQAIDDAVDFLMKYDDHAQLRTLRPVTPYPGSPLFDYAVAQGYIKDTEDFYLNKHLNSDLLCVNFTKASEIDIYDKLNWANKILIDKYIDQQKKGMIGACDDLYMNRNADFRGFRQT